MENYKALDKHEWAKHYNIKLLNSIISSIKKDQVSVWSREINEIGNRIDIGKKNNDISYLEIGCGSGQSSLYLASKGKLVTAVDYSEDSINLINEAKKQLNLKNLNAILCDASKEMPFAKKSFDFIFQAGLLEHFDTETQVSLLKKWSIYGKYMVSMIPNASSVPYRVGKEIMEKNGTWEYGLEIPAHSLKEEFYKADIEVIKEYTIDIRSALSFLPKDHYIRKCFLQLMEDGYKLDNLMQGYLLVTIGRCK